MIGWRPVALVILAAVLVAITFLDVGSASACGDAKRLLRSGRLAEARTAYVKLLGDDATSRCADRGLDAVAEAQCTRAEKLARLGRDKESVEAYTSIATVEPVRADKYCEKALVPARQQTCADVASVDADAYPQTAWKDYVALLDEPQQRDCATEALTRIGTARCNAARALLDGSQAKAAQKQLLALATTEPLIGAVTRCAVKALD